MSRQRNHSLYQLEPRMDESDVVSQPEMLDCYFFLSKTSLMKQKTQPSFINNMTLKFSVD